MIVKSFCTAAAIVVSAAIAANAQDGPKQILFTNASVFDGFAENLIEGANVLVEGNVITQVSTDAIDAPGASVIDATGKYLRERPSRTGDRGDTGQAAKARQ